jgi:hypothetical protein
MNAKEEFLMVTENAKVICSTITISYSWYSSTTFNLKPGYTPEEYQRFIDNLDFEYDDGPGTQYLFGTICCEDGLWYDRHEYDGSECWYRHKYPTIPPAEEWGADKIVITEKDINEENDYLINEDNFLQDF